MKSKIHEFNKTKLKSIRKKIILASLLIVGISITSCQSQTKGNSSNR